MTIHPEQQNVELLCEHAHFVDSGFQSFHEQVRGLRHADIPEAAFFAGAALTLKLMEYFRDKTYSEEDAEFLIGLIYEEVGDFMEKNGMVLEWEPHVPREKKQ